MAALGGCVRLARGAAVVALAAAAAACPGERAADPSRILEGALARVSPATYYYVVYQASDQVGVASSAVDTSSARMRATDFFTGRLVIAGDSQTVGARSAAYLSAGLRMDSLVLAVGGDQTPLRLRAYPAPGTRVLPPQLAPMALMLSGPARVGREATYWIYNPVARDAERTTLRVAAESLFTVAAGSAYDSTARRWTPAGRDTVRAWRVTTATGAVTAWVDRQGRVVAAGEPGGLRLERAPYEVAFGNWRTRQRDRAGRGR